MFYGDWSHVRQQYEYNTLLVEHSIKLADVGVWKVKLPVRELLHRRDNNSQGCLAEKKVIYDLGILGLYISEYYS